ncbi:cell filamentation protein [Nocardiopsis terrae]|uniref:protein adenylyltransferase n=1 Tax=Nocardiopsis terrae TaxID=372655 RepID=A0ABR9HP38_9ACTN|nr:Fic family protein [Nocardiopsis terrae]MBE1460772.1 cell filamentation protein [Nocardiopsis terrae]
MADHPVPGGYDLAHLCRFHKEIFTDLYPWAGQIRTVNIAKGTWFCPVQNIQRYATDIFERLAGQDHLRGLGREKFVPALTEFYGDLNALHLFREGNGRAQRAFVGQLAREAGYRTAWERLDSERNDQASAVSLSRGEHGPLLALLDELVEGPA